MIISHEHKFIFLKTKKTAGTSFELALSSSAAPTTSSRLIAESDEALRAEGAAAQNWRCMAGGRARGRCSSAAG